MAASSLCASCGNPLEPDDRFCGICGTPVLVHCATCGAAIRPGHRFCAACGAAVAVVTPPAAEPAAGTEAARAPPASVALPEERRLATAVFCDLAGFTSLSERLDPEEVRALQVDYFGAMAEQIERYGGIVEKYAGDAVLALFGVPVAHEDDAERAVLCALGMQTSMEQVAARVRDRWQVELGIRVGVNTGEVVSGSWDVTRGVPGRQGAAITGDAVNTAARMQAAAGLGEVLAGAETMRLTRRRIQYGEPRNLNLKGKAGTVPAWRAVGLRDHPGEHWEERALETPLVGRGRELSQLAEAWRRAEGGEGGIVTLVGEPGVGKSRLAAEMLRTVASSGATRIVRGRCLSYGQEISLWLIADLLRDLCVIREADGLDEICARLESVIPTLLNDRDQDVQTEALDVIGEVLGLPARDSPVQSAGPAIRRHALVRSLRSIIGALSEGDSLILVLEDLHWIDAASEDALEEILVDVPGRRVLVLATARAGWSAPWGEWGWTERVTVRPLREQEAAILAEAVLSGRTQGARLSPELERYLAVRAAGNPFFVEELVRALQETGGIVEREAQMVLLPVAAQRLPSTLTEILLARLDRLEARPKMVAQVGSVIGRSFAVRLLAGVIGQDQVALEEPLTALQRAEIAFPHRSPDVEYVFKHVTMREVAYNTLVSKRRQQIHLQTARTIAALYPSDEYAEMIAYHYARTDAPEAAEWLERAGDRAAAIYSNDAALSHYTDARRRREAAGETERDRLDVKLGEVLYTAGRYDEAIAVLTRAIERYQIADDLEAAGNATALLGRVHRQRGTPEEGIARVQPMVELLEASGPSTSLASLHVALSHLYMPIGKYQEMLASAERGGELARSLGDERLLGEAEMRRGTALAQLGQVEAARSVLERALPLVEAGGDLTTLFITLSNIGGVVERLGAIEQMRRYTEQALSIAERLGNPSRICFSLANLSGTLVTLGEWREAQRHLDRGETLARTVGNVPDAAWGMLSMGHLLLRQGDLEGARSYINATLSMLEGTEARQNREIAESYLAELDLLEGRPQPAIDRLEPLAEADDAELGEILPILVQALLLLETEEGDRRAEEEAVRLVAWAREQPTSLVAGLWVQGMVATRRARYGEAERVLGEALSLARRLPFPYAEALILSAHSENQRARGEIEKAQQSLEEALAIFRRLGSVKQVERTEEMLRRNSHNS